MLKMVTGLSKKKKLSEKQKIQSNKSEDENKAL